MTSKPVNPPPARHSTNTTAERGGSTASSATSMVPQSNVMHGLLQDMVGDVLKKAAGTLNTGPAQTGQVRATPQAVARQPPEDMLESLQKGPVTSVLAESLASTDEGAQALELLITTRGGQQALNRFTAGVVNLVKSAK